MPREYAYQITCMLFLILLISLIYGILHHLKLIKLHEKKVWKIAFSVIFLGFSYKIFSLGPGDGYLELAAKLAEDVTGKLLLAGLMVVVFDVWMHRVTQAEVKDAAEKAAQKIEKNSIAQIKAMKDEALQRIDAALGTSAEKIVDARVRPDVQDAIKLACADTELTISCASHVFVEKSRGSGEIEIEVVETYSLSNNSERTQAIAFRKLSTSRLISIIPPAVDYAQSGMQFDVEDNVHSIEVGRGEMWEVTVQHELQGCSLASEMHIVPLFLIGAKNYEITIIHPVDISVSCKMHGGWYNRIKSREIGDAKSSRKTKVIIDAPLFPYIPIFLKFERNLAIYDSRPVFKEELKGMEDANFILKVDGDEADCENNVAGQ